MFEKYFGKKKSERENMFDKCVDDFSTNNNMNKLRRKKHQSFFDVNVSSDDCSTTYVISAKKPKIKYIDVIVDGDYLIIKYEKNRKLRSNDYKYAKCCLQIKRYYIGKNVTDINKEKFKDKIILTIDKKEL